MGYREHAPHPALAPFVDRLWASEPGGDAPTCVLPDGCIDVIVDPDAETLEIVGTMTRAIVIPADATARRVAVRFRPGGAVAFFGVPADALTDLTVDRVALGACWLCAPLERALLERLAAARRPDRVIEHLVAQLSGRSPPSIAALSRDTGWSRQHLTRRVRAAVGVGPKQLARIARLHRAVQALQRPGADLAGVALELGFFDQPHLARELRDLAGITPREAARGRGSIRPIRSLYAAP